MGKVYTKFGDKGFTALYGGTKVKKSSRQVAAYGAVDEANSAIGLAASHLCNKELSELLRLCQKKLFVLGAELASDSKGRKNLKELIVAQDAEHLEMVIDALSQLLNPDPTFKIPGQTLKSALLHMARSTVRRAEREIIGVKGEAQVSPDVIIYINRLSDLLFIMSRVVDEVDMFIECEQDK